MQNLNYISKQDLPIPRYIYSDNKCQDCSHKNTCLANMLNGDDLFEFNSIVKHSQKLSRGEYLYRAGDRFNSIYIIRSGSIKTFIDDAEGREQILGFSIQGDLLALDGLSSTTYPTSAQSLETTYVCEIPFANYMELAVKYPKLYQQLLNKACQQIQDEEKHTLLIGTKSAEKRLATLLINFSNRYTAKGFSKTEFCLHMSRRDIGNYISAAMETVSRIFSRLQARGFIEVHGKLVKIKDLRGLEKYAA